MTLLVLLPANHVQSRPTLVAKEETAVVSSAPSVGRRKRAVRNVSRVVRVHLAMGAKVVLSAMQDITPIWTRPNVDNVLWGKPQRRLLRRLAKSVTWVDLVTAVVFVQHAHVVCTKIQKVKPFAEKCVSRLAKYPTTTAPGVNCHRGVPAKWGNT